MKNEEIYKRYYNPEKEGYSRELAEAIKILNDRGTVDERDLYFLSLAQSLYDTHPTLDYKWFKFTCESGNRRLKILLNLMK